MKTQITSLFTLVLLNASFVMAAGQTTNDPIKSCEESQVQYQISEEVLETTVTSAEGFLKSCTHQSGKISRNLNVQFTANLPMKQYAYMVIHPRTGMAFTFGLTRSVGGQHQLVTENPEVTEFLLKGDALQILFTDESGFSTHRAEFSLRPL